MRTDNLSNESEKKLNILHNDLVNPAKNPYDDIYDYLFSFFKDKKNVKLDSIEEVYVQTIHDREFVNKGE